MHGIYHRMFANVNVWLSMSIDFRPQCKHTCSFLAQLENTSALC